MTVTVADIALGLGVALIGGLLFMLITDRIRRVDHDIEEVDQMTREDRATIQQMQRDIHNIVRTIKDMEGHD